MDRLGRVRDQVSRCTGCGLSGTRKNAVPGGGNFRSEVVFVGEAPGRSEDACGKPFVGAAGKKLTAALEDSGVSRDAVYITNVVKCRPPGNRVPDSTERDACAGYLQEEIRIISPRVVCILGNTAFNSILGGTGITRYRGKVVRKDGLLYFVTVHPAAAIYRHELLDVLKADIRKLFGVITELKNGRDVQVDIECAPHGILRQGYSRSSKGAAGQEDRTQDRPAGGLSGDHRD